MRESSVLYAATEEILIRLFAQAEGYLFGGKLCRNALLCHGLSVFEVDDPEELGSLVKDDLCLGGRKDDGVVVFLHLHLLMIQGSAWIIHQDARLRLCLGRSHHAIVVIFEDTENTFAIEIYGDTLLVGEDNLHQRRIDSENLNISSLHGLGCLLGIGSGRKQGR